MPELGPERITPNGAPGGLVVHVYTSAGELVVIRALLPGEIPARAAEVDGAATAGLPGPVHMVVYDGDSGARFGIVDTW